MTLKVIIKCDNDECDNKKGFFSAHELADQPEWWPVGWVRDEDKQCDYCPECSGFEVNNEIRN